MRRFPLSPFSKLTPEVPPRGIHLELQTRVSGSPVEAVSVKYWFPSLHRLSVKVLVSVEFKRGCGHCLPQTSQLMLRLAPLHTLFTQQEAGMNPSVFKSPPGTSPIYNFILMRQKCPIWTPSPFSRGTVLLKALYTWSHPKLDF